MSSPLFPEPPPSIPATSLPDCDAAVDKLYAARGRWVRTSIAERILLLKRCLDGMAEVCEAWVRDACRAKGHAPGSHGEGEEWLGGPMPTIRNLRMLVEALEAGGAPKPVSGRARPDGRYVAQVFPSNIFERIMFAGVTAEVWIEPTMVSKTILTSLMLRALSIDSMTKVFCSLVRRVPPLRILLTWRTFALKRFTS